MFNLEPRQQGSTLSLRLTGTVLMDDVASFNETMRDYSKKPDVNQLVLDLGEVEKMDNAGLGILVSLHTSMQRYGKRLVLAHISPTVEKLLVDAEIEGFFPTCESEEELKGFIAEGMRSPA